MVSFPYLFVIQRGLSSAIFTDCGPQPRLAGGLRRALAAALLAAAAEAQRLWWRSGPGHVRW